MNAYKGDFKTIFTFMLITCHDILIFSLKLANVWLFDPQSYGQHFLEWHKIEKKTATKCKAYL